MKSLVIGMLSMCAAVNSDDYQLGEIEDQTIVDITLEVLMEAVQE